MYKCCIGCWRLVLICGRWWRWEVPFDNVYISSSSFSIVISMKWIWNCHVVTLINDTISTHVPKASNWSVLGTLQHYLQLPWRTWGHMCEGALWVILRLWSSSLGGTYIFGGPDWRTVCTMNTDVSSLPSPSFPFSFCMAHGLCLC